MTEDFIKPNGLCFSPDERLMYIADTGRVAMSRTDRVTSASSRSDPTERASPTAALFATCDVGVFDGFRCDTSGNLWTSAGDGVHCYAPDGTLLGKIRIPEVVANVCFGGPKRNRLYICGTTSLYAVYVNAQASALAPVGGVRPSRRSRDRRAGPRPAPRSKGLRRHEAGDGRLDAAGHRAIDRSRLGRHQTRFVHLAVAMEEDVAAGVARMGRALAERGPSALPWRGRRSAAGP